MVGVPEETDRDTGSRTANLASLKADDPGMSFESISLNLARAHTLHVWALFWFLVGISRGSHGNVKKSRSRSAKAGEG